MQRTLLTGILAPVLTLTSLVFTVLILSASNTSAADAPAYEVGVFQPTAQADFVPADSKLEVLWNEGEFTEGPTLAVDGTILFSDIGHRIMQFDPASGKTTVYRDPSGKTNGLMFNQQGELIACEGAAGGNRRVSRTTKSGEVQTLTGDFEGKKYNSPNDLAIDAEGWVYFTDPRYGGDEPRELDFEGIFVVSPKGKARLASRDVQKPNGILVSLDGKHVYAADNNPSGNRHLVVFDVAKNRTLKNKKLLYDFGTDQRGIDGMTLDVDGNLYATAGTGDKAGIYIFDPSGKHLAFVPTPGDPTNCVFGGGQESSTLYITAAGPKTASGSSKYALYRIRLSKDGHHIFPPVK